MTTTMAPARQPASDSAPHEGSASVNGRDKGVVGIRAFRGGAADDSRVRARTASTGTGEAPYGTAHEQTPGVGAAPAASTTWGSDDDASLERKRAEWKRMRDEQMADAKRHIDGRLAAVAALAAAVALARAAGPTARRVAGWALVLWLARRVYALRAPDPLIKRDERWNPIPGRWRILGDTPPLITTALTDSLLAMQHRVAQNADWRTFDVGLFGAVREIALYHPLDREFMLRNPHLFTKNPPPGVPLDSFEGNFAELFGRGIFAVDGGEWTDHRKIASHLFSANALRNKFEATFARHSDELVRILADYADAKRPLDWQVLMQAFTFDTTCSFTAGHEADAMKTMHTTGQQLEFLRAFDSVQQKATLRFVLPMFFWRTLRYLDLGYERDLRRDAAVCDAYVSKIVEERLAKIDASSALIEDSGADDLLSLYLKTGKAQGKLHFLDPGFAKDVVMNFMVAGRDTTSCTLINLFIFLDQNPDVAKRMRDEFARVVGPTRHVGFDDVRELRYCSAVINETLRLRPPVPGDSRIVLEDVVLPGSGVAIPKHTKTIIPVSAIGRDPHLWTDPLEFKPERWLDPEHPDAVVRRTDEFVHPVFWGGPRLCLGHATARLEALTVANAVLRSFNVRPDPARSERIANGPVQFYMFGVPAVVERV